MELSQKMRVIPTFLLYGTLTVEPKWPSARKKCSTEQSYRSIMGYRSGNQYHQNKSALIRHITIHESKSNPLINIDSHMIGWRVPAIFVHSHPRYACGWHLKWIPAPLRWHPTLPVLPERRSPGKWGFSHRTGWVRVCLYTTAHILGQMPVIIWFPIASLPPPLKMYTPWSTLPD